MVCNADITVEQTVGGENIFRIEVSDGQSLTVSEDELVEITKKASLYVDRMEEVNYFIEKWNDMDILISSMDMDGNNVPVLDREIIDKRNLQWSVCRIKDEVAHVEMNMTAQSLIDKYLNGELKIFQEVPYL